MRVFTAALLVTLVACGPRQAEVRTAPSTTAETSLHFTNNLSQAVNVYVSQNGTDMFVHQVAAKSTEDVAVPGVASGSVVTLKATLVDGSRTYSRANVSMSESVDWSVP
jgi:hypothetical protein